MGERGCKIKNKLTVDEDNQGIQKCHYNSMRHQTIARHTSDKPREAQP
jgi:hypothetical protein